MGIVRERNLVNAERIVLNIMQGRENKRWTIQEIIKQVDHMFGEKPIRQVLCKLEEEGKLVLRRYKHNRFSYSRHPLITF